MRFPFACILALLIALSLNSCSDDSRFVVRGTTPGTENMNLRFGYNSPEGYRSGVVAVREGKFEFAGVSSRPTLVEMFEHDYTPLGRLCLANGDNVECVLSRGVPEAIKVAGSPLNERWAEYLNANAGVLRSDEGNAAVAAYVAAHPDDILSTLLLVTQYDVRRNPLQADSLLALVAPAARPEFIAGDFAYLLGRVAGENTHSPVDSINFVAPDNRVEALAPAGRKATVYFFSDDEAMREDSVVAALVRFAAAKGVAVADIYLSPDTMAWKRMIRSERVKGVDDSSLRRGWLPGSLGAPQLQRLGVVDLPFAVVCDSSGTQICRTRYTGVVSEVLESM